MFTYLQREWKRASVGCPPEATQWATFTTVEAWTTFAYSLKINGQTKNLTHHSVFTFDVPNNQV